ncbi:MAG TPA: glycosyltransferase family 4 protein, partial [Longimicrobium sp.]|nr:glycosyltransferase family 4 protein [Longimicrobium sp.]
MSARLRVLHCIYDDPANPWVAGGGAHRVREIYRRLGDRVDAVVASGSYPGARDEEVDGVRYRRLGAPRPYAWSRLTYARAATRLLAARDYDAAVFDFSVYTPIRLPRGAPVGLVVHMLHGTTAADRFGRVLGGAVRAAEARGLRQARWISTTSRWMEEQLRGLADPATRIVRVGSGVPDEFAAVRRDERDHLLFYGRFDLFHKGIDVALQAFARIAAARPEVRLVLAGRGKDEARVRALADGLGGGRVEVRAGADRAEVLELMSGALALLMPSRIEGLPMVPAEAMAAGVPVIATDVAAVAEVVAPPDGGVLVPPGDAEALAA